jgi:DNA polymerase I-like protein with 3'-5' exonuclease and polymerase domains
MTLVLDIETKTGTTNKILDREIRLIGVYSIEEDTYHTFSAVHFFKEWLENEHRRWQRTGSTTDIITWNGSRFDLVVLSQALDKTALNQTDVMGNIFRGLNLRHIDLMLLLKIVAPDFKAGYSLDAWIKHYKLPYTQKEFKSTEDKLDFYDNSPLVDLSEYCKDDLRATADIFATVMRDYNLDNRNDWQHALKIETEVARLTEVQYRRGVRFDTDKASDELNNLDRELKEIESKIYKNMPEMPIPKSKLKYPPKIQFKQDGSLSYWMENYLSLHGYTLSTYDPKTKTVTNFSPVPHGTKSTTVHLPITKPLRTHARPSLGQSAIIKDYLLSIGWKPTMWNVKKRDGKYEKTSPRLTNQLTKEPCPNLGKLAPWTSDLSMWYTLRSRRNLIKSPKGTGLLPEALKSVSKCGRHCIIRADADTMGTNTSRYRHRGIVNIPRSSSVYGKEMRSLFRARAGYTMVGWDASGLESAIEAHYVHPFDPDYADSLVSGSSDLGTDVHTRNWKALGLSDRDQAKTFKYAVTYGAQPPRLADITGKTVKEAEEVFDQFWQHNKGLHRFKQQLTQEWIANNKSYIQGLDGRRVYIRSEHSLVNACFQSGGAILMKHAMLIADRLIKKIDSPSMNGLRCWGLIRMHDEEQWEVSNDIDAEQVGKLGVQSIEKAAKYLKLRVPVTGEYKVGDNWSLTH